MEQTKVLVIIPTITGREKLFERCKKSLERAYEVYPVDYTLVSEKDSSREEILRNIDLRDYNYVTFIDDDDYVTSKYFGAVFNNYDIKTKSNNVVICDRIGLYPSKNVIYNNASVGVGENTLFDAAKLTSGKKYSTPIWYVTGIFFSVNIMENFKKKILSKYDIKGCWEDLMYWAFLEKGCKGLHVIPYNEGKYVQVCTSTSLTRKNPKKDIQMDYNMDLVKEYLLTQGMTKEEISLCFAKINRCRSRKYGEYGYSCTQSGKMRVLDSAPGAEEWQLLPEEIEGLGGSWYRHPVEIMTEVVDVQMDLPEKIAGWIGKPLSDEYVVTKIESRYCKDEDREDEYTLIRELYKHVFENVGFWTPMYQKWYSRDPEFKDISMVSYRYYEGGWKYIFWKKDTLEEYLKKIRPRLVERFSESYVDWLYSQLAKVHARDSYLGNIKYTLNI